MCVFRIFAKLQRNTAFINIIKYTIEREIDIVLIDKRKLRQFTHKRAIQLYIKTIKQRNLHFSG